MFKNKEKGIGSEKGFTMIELIIVIAIMGILSAILVPSFTQMTRKSRLRADISTIQQVQTQIDLYVAEHDGEYPTSDGTEPGDGALDSSVVKKLVDDQYLREKDVVKDASGNIDGIKLQTKNNVKVNYHKEATNPRHHLVLNITGGISSPTTDEGKIGKSLSDSDKEWMR